MFAGPGENQFNSYTGDVNPVSMSEAFIKAPGGAVAAFSPTGQGLTNLHSPLAEYLYNTIFGTGYAATYSLPVNPVLGLAIQSAEKYVLLNPSYGLASGMPETISIFVLLGDPATQLAVP
jgi:hypothetical protein